MPNNSSGYDMGFDLGEASPLEQMVNVVGKAIDPFGVTTSLVNAGMAWLMHPQELSRALYGLSDDFLSLQAHTWRRALGLDSEDVVQPHADDARFADPVWKEVAGWDVIKEWYLAFTHRLEDMYFETPGLASKERRRAAFWLRKWLNMMAPTNFFWLNPVAIKRFVDTGGQSLAQGGRHFMRDLEAKNILMVEPDAFAVGKDLATTPGKVIFRNRLLELIHYAPSTPQVRSVPIVIVTPWINKFYILDLNSKKSLVKYLVDQGFSVFITSWKNPGTDMAEVRLDDYLTEGVDDVVKAVCNFCQVPRAHLVGYCIGGTLAAIYMAWANRHYEVDRMPVAHWTLFTTLTDFSLPGDIDVFIDEASIRSLEDSMARKGYLDGSDMAASFRMLRSNPLIWHYWVHSYLLGEPLPAFDVLFWNMDTTRMPRAMHSRYLRDFYLENNLIKRDHLTLAGHAIDLDCVTQPLYAVTAEDDHIAPWKQCYRIRKYINVAAPMRFSLSSSGHILGIVNPPLKPPKRAYRIGNPERNEHWEKWLARAEKHSGSWWEDWVAWLNGGCGDLVTAYPSATETYPPLTDAPGLYVLEK